MKRILAAAAGACSLAAALAPGAADASAFAVRDTSAESVGMVTAGNGSRADDLDTIFNNPAGMTYFAGDQVEAGLLLLHSNVDFSGRDTLAGMPVSGLMGNAGRFGAAPNLYALHSITERLKLGLAITAPFGLLVKYNQPWIGRYLGTEGEIVTIDINPNLAYRVSDWLSLGGGVSVQYLHGILASSINQAAILGAPGTPDADAKYDAEDWAVGYNLGVLAEPIRGTRLGLTYRSKVSHEQRGKFTFSNVAPALGPGGLGILVDHPETVEDFSAPASIGLSITQQLAPAWSISADAVFTQWSSEKMVTIADAGTGVPVAAPLVTGFHDTWSVAVGASYRWTERWTLRGGIGWDETPVPDRFRSVFLPDQSRITVGFGLGYRWNAWLTFDVGYAHFFPTGRTRMTGSANAVDPVTGSVLSGSYDLSLDEAALSARVRF